LKLIDLEKEVQRLQGELEAIKFRRA